MEAIPGRVWIGPEDTLIIDELTLDPAPVIEYMRVLDDFSRALAGASATKLTATVHYRDYMQFRRAITAAFGSWVDPILERRRRRVSAMHREYHHRARRRTGRRKPR